MTIQQEYDDNNNNITRVAKIFLLLNRGRVGALCMHLIFGTEPRNKYMHALVLIATRPSETRTKTQQ